MVWLETHWALCKIIPSMLPQHWWSDSHSSKMLEPCTKTGRCLIDVTAKSEGSTPLIPISTIIHHLEPNLPTSHPDTCFIKITLNVIVSPPCTYSECPLRFPHRNSVCILTSFERRFRTIRTSLFPIF